jgi:hypothetical protein
MWKVIQFLVFGAVIVSNVHWQWTPNGYLGGWIGIALAFIVTVVPVRVNDMLRGVAHWATQKMADRPMALGGATSRVSLDRRHAVPSVSARSGGG